MSDGLSNPAEHWETVARNNFKRIEQLEEALKELIELQSLYANLLNMYDGGERIQFKNSEEWLDRVKSRKNL